MSIYNLTLFALGDATVTPDPDIIGYNVTGEQWGWGWGSTPTFTVDNGATAQSVEINDTDADPDTFSDEIGYNPSQVLTSDLTINGTTYAAGSELQDEYEADFVDDFGNSYTLVAVSVQVYDGSGGYWPEFIGFTWDGEQPPTGVTLTYASAYEDHASMMPMVPCFTAGTMILTEKGPKQIESLTPGDMIVTADHGLQPLRWIGSRHLDDIMLQQAPNLRPIQIRAGALGPNAPEQDLYVSPQHRVLVRSKITERICGEQEALVAAKHLSAMPGIDVADQISDVTYIHLLFDHHEVVVSNGAETESLFPGAQALKGMPVESRIEILTLFPELMARDARFPARKLLAGKYGHRLTERHLKNAKPLCADQKVARD